MMIARCGFGAEDKELLENELLEKVVTCIEEYDTSYDAKFDTFTNRCLMNHIQVHLRGEKRKKHSFISNSMSLDYTIDEGDTISELIADPKAISADTIIFNITLSEIMNLLPDVCKEIVSLLCAGLSESEIARIIGEESRLVRGYIEECIQPLVVELLLCEERNDG